MSSDPKVEEIRARRAAATPGPWCHYPEAGTIEIAEGGDEAHSGAILVSSVRPRLGWGADIYTGDEPDAEFIANAPTDIDCLLDRLDEANAALERARSYSDALGLTIDAEERERTLIAGVKEAIRALDLVDVHQYELGSGSVGDIARTLSRLLPSDELPTVPGMYEGQRRARWELDDDGRWWFRGYLDREHPTPDQQDRTEFDVRTYGMPLLPSTPTEEGQGS